MLCESIETFGHVAHPLTRATPLYRILHLIGVIFGLRPIFTPRATARARPSREDQVALELCSPPSTVSISRPCDLVVSAHASPKDRNPAFLLVIAASVFNRSRVDRASRSSRVTVNTS